MLIITRRKGQRIALGHDIEIVITDITRSGVKIGIVAPTSLTVLRGEVKEAVEQANRAAAGSFVEPTVDAVAEVEAAIGETADESPERVAAAR